MQLQVVNTGVVMAQVELQRLELKLAAAVVVVSSAAAADVVRSQVVPYKTAVAVADLAISTLIALPSLKLLMVKTVLVVKHSQVEAQALST
jgi:hypothetical protein